MKFHFLLVLSFVSIAAKAQTLVLTQGAYEPAIGDSSFYHVLDTNYFWAGLPNSTAGSNSTWNFSNLISTAVKANSSYVDPITVPSATAYAGTNVVQKQGALFNYFKSVTTPSPQTEMLGLSSNTLNLNFTNSAILAKYPVSYGNSFTDNIAGTFNFSVSGTFNGSVSTSADGAGTLHLPNGLSLSNVLRVKSVQTINLGLGIIPFGTAKQTVYNYFHSSQKFPVLNITYTSLSIIGSTSPSVSAIVTGNSKTIIVGVDEEGMALSNLSLYPNPAREVIFIDANQFLGEVQIELFDSKGARVYTTKRILNGGTTEVVSLSDLPRGFYFVKLQSGTHSLQRKMILQD